MLGLKRTERQRESIRSGAPQDVRIRLTGMDIGVASDAPVNYSFIYKEALEPSRLKEGLQMALRVYPQFAGRVVRQAENYLLDLNDEGITFDVETSEHRLDTLNWNSPIVDIYPDLEIRQFPLAVLDRGGAVCHIRLLQLAGGGSILVFAHSHAIADAQAGFTFLHYWSDCCLGIQEERIQDAVLDKTAFSALSKGHSVPDLFSYARYDLLSLCRSLGVVFRLSRDKRRSETAVFHYSADELEGFHQDAKASMNDEGYLSVQDALVAFIWREIAFSRLESHCSKLNYILNFRQRNGIPLSSEYIGNAVVARTPQNNHMHVMGDVRQMSLGDIALEIRKLFHSVTPEIIGEEISYMEHLFARRGRHQLIGMGVDIAQGATTINNWSCFKGYDLDMGLGKPLWFNPVIWPWSNFIHITENQAQDGGVMVQVQLPKKEMAIYKSRYQMQHGSFEITELPDKWTAAITR